VGWRLDDSYGAALRGRILFGWLLVSAVLGLAVTALGQSQRYFPPPIVNNYYASDGGGGSAAPLDAGVLVVNQVVADAGTIGTVTITGSGVDFLAPNMLYNSGSGTFDTYGYCFISGGNCWNPGSPGNFTSSQVVTGTFVADAGSFGSVGFAAGGSVSNLGVGSCSAALTTTCSATTAGSTSSSKCFIGIQSGTLSAPCDCAAGTGTTTVTCAAAVTATFNVLTVN
jgi:hypothetical protein